MEQTELFSLYLFKAATHHADVEELLPTEAD